MICLQCGSEMIETTQYFSCPNPLCDNFHVKEKNPKDTTDDKCLIEIKIDSLLSYYRNMLDGLHSPGTRWLEGYETAMKDVAVILNNKETMLIVSAGESTISFLCVDCGLWFPKDQSFQYLGYNRCMSCERKKILVIK